MRVLVMLAMLAGSLLAQPGIDPESVVEIWHWSYNDCDLNIPAGLPRDCSVDKIAIVVYSNSRHATHFHVTVSFRRMMSQQIEELERLIEAQDHCRGCSSAFIVPCLPLGSKVIGIEAKAFTAKLIGEKAVKVD